MYENGQIHGFKKYYYETGKLFLEVDFKND